MSGMRLFGYRIPAKPFVGGLIFWFIIGLVLWNTGSLPFYSEGAPGPRLMPAVLAAIFSVLTVLYWIDAATKEPPGEHANEERNFLRPLAFVGITVVLALCWVPLGALLSVLLCSVIELRFLERFSWLRSIFAGLIITATVIVLFQIVLGVPLPGGLFESLSYVRL